MDIFFSFEKNIDNNNNIMKWNNIYSRNNNSLNNKLSITISKWNLSNTSKNLILILIIKLIYWKKKINKTIIN